MTSQHLGLTSHKIRFLTFSPNCSPTLPPTSGNRNPSSRHTGQAPVSPSSSLCSPSSDLTSFLTSTQDPAASLHLSSSPWSVFHSPLTMDSCIGLPAPTLATCGLLYNPQERDQLGQTSHQSLLFWKPPGSPASSEEKPRSTPSPMSHKSLQCLTAHPPSL